MDTNANNGYSLHDLDPDDLLECQNSFPLLSLAPEVMLFATIKRQNWTSVECELGE